MKIFDVIRYDNEEDRNVFAWRCSNKEIGYATTLQVSPGQKAVLFSNGRLVETFEVGKHRIDGNNVPVLTSIKKMFTGGVSTDTNYIWFINDFEIPPVFWGTSNRQSVNIPMGRDGRTMTALVGARGHFTVEIVNLEKFIVNYMVSQPDTITMEQLQKRFSQESMASITDGINSVFIDGKIPFDEITARKIELAHLLKPELNDNFEKLGIAVTNFIIDDINLDSKTLDKIISRQNLREDSYAKGKSEEDYSIGSTVASRKFSDARVYSQENEGYSYQEKRKYDVLQEIAGNEGSGSNMVNTGIGLGAGLGLGKSIGDIISDNSSIDDSTTSKNIHSGNHCIECGYEGIEEAKFCSSCGQEVGN